MPVTEIHLRDHFTSGESPADITPALQRAVRALHDRGGGNLYFPRGIFHLRAETAHEFALSISNHDSGFKYVGIELNGLRDVGLIGDETTLLIHDKLVPIFAKGCVGLSITGLRIDWPQPFYGQAFVESAQPGEIIAQLDQALPWYAMNGRLIFTGEGWQAPLEHVFALDSKSRRPLAGAHDNCGAGWFHQWRVDSLENGRIRLQGNFPRTPQISDVLVLRPGEQRDAPAIVLESCEQVSLRNLTIHHAGGMGIIAQRCREVHLQKVRVEPSAGRFFSTTVDATHFVGCAGEITLEDCHFSGQLDDPANIHGIYAKILRALGPRSIRVQLEHPQQRGFSFAAPGDLLGLVRGPSLEDYAQARLTEFRPLNRRTVDLVFDQALPDDILPGDGVDNLGWHPHVTIRRCWMGHNRARGPLVGTRAGALIESNVFRTPGAALQCSPDCRFWFESAPVQNLIIRQNRFENCGTENNWGGAAIVLDPSIDTDRKPARGLIRNVVIEENVFVTDGPPCLLARHVEDLIVRRNQIVRPSMCKSGTAGQPSPSSNWDVRDCHGLIELQPYEQE